VCVRAYRCAVRATGVGFSPRLGMLRGERASSVCEVAAGRSKAAVLCDERVGGGQNVACARSSFWVDDDGTTCASLYLSPSLSLPPSLSLYHRARGGGVGGET
jgi:hypothetical protein